jgi:heat shock protein HslJ/uncharacterized membrane protein
MTDKHHIQIALLSTLMLIISSCNNKPIPENSHEPIAKSDLQIVSEIQSSDDFQMNLWQKGIDFYARGNEPSWALDMDFEHIFTFKTMQGLEISVPLVIGTKAQDANVTRYYAEAESGTLIITIQEQKCQDTMADQEFDFSVRVQVKTGKQEDFEEYEGCGNFVPDFSIHDIWVLEKANGNDLKIAMNGKELPRFEFFAREGKVLGFAGCNQFNGHYSIVGKGEIQFDEVAMTEKMCAGIEIENILSKALFGRRMKYSKESLNLIFTGYDGSEFIFKKID